MSSILLHTDSPQSHQIILPLYQKKLPSTHLMKIVVIPHAAFEMTSERTPLVLDGLKPTRTQATTLLTAGPSRTESDINLNRPSSKATATVQAYAPAIPKALQNPITFQPGIKRATVSVISLRSDSENQQQPLVTMANISTRHANTNKTLEMGQRVSPPKPSAWHDAVHHDQLIRVWDTVCDVTVRNPNYPRCITSQVRSTLNAMVKRCPELAQGRVPLTPDWIEFVLGKALRPPFCTAAMMGRWEILAVSAGSRSMWGPW